MNELARSKKMCRLYGAVLQVTRIQNPNNICVVSANFYQFFLMHKTYQVILLAKHIQ